MGKRLGIFGIAIGAAALVVGVALPAAASSDPPGQDGTFNVTATITEVSQIDLGASGSSLGDEIVFTGKLLQGEHQVGHQGAVCTTVSAQAQEAQCVATYSFRGGQITAQSLIILDSPDAYDVAVTGGTGRYRSAAGVVHVLPATATNPNGTLTFHLEN